MNISAIQRQQSLNFVSRNQQHESNDFAEGGLEPGMDANKGLSLELNANARI